MSATGSYLVTDYSDWWGAEKKITSTSTDKDAVNIDVNNPNYSRIFSMARDGQNKQVIEALSSIQDQSSSRAARAKALYHKYVFYQRQGLFEKSLDVAKTFMDKYKNHALRPEVMYGAGLMCKEHLDECDTNYHEQLRREYPDSSWTDEISSSS